MVFYTPAVIVIFLAGCGVVKVKKPCKNCGADSSLNVYLANYNIICTILCGSVFQLASDIPSFNLEPLDLFV